MNKECAISIVESVSGFTDESTPAGEAWGFIQAYIATLESALSEIVRIGAECPDGTYEVEVAMAALSFSTPTIHGA